MENKKPQIVAIDGVEYDAADFTEEQTVLVNHCFDLDRKMGSTVFQLQQLEVGKKAFMDLLKEALKPKVEVLEE